MQRRRYEASRNVYWPAMAGIALLCLVPRLIGLDALENIDGCAYWFNRSLEFYKALWRGDLDGTYISGHPGVTIMLMSGASIVAAGLVKFQSLALVPYFAELLFWAKLPIVLFTTAAVLTVYHALHKHHGSASVALLAGLFLAIDPLFLAHSRFLHLDAVTSIGMLLSVLWLGIYSESLQRRHLILAGLFAGFAILTKSYAGALAPFTLCAIPVIHWLASRRRHRPRRELLLDLAAWSLAAGAMYVVLWPAMWVSPIDTLMQVARAAGFAITHLHENQAPINGVGGAIIGEALETELSFDGRMLAQLLGGYPLLPIFLALVPVVNLWRRNAVFRPGRGVVVCLALFAAFFGLGMAFTGKAGPRYLIAICMILDVLAAYGACQLFSLVRSRPARRVAAPAQAAFAGALALTAVSVFAVHPYYGTYQNRLIDPEYIGWGEGLDMVARHFAAKPDAAALKIASFYPCLLRKLAGCDTVSLDEISGRPPDYVVLYKGQVDRQMYPEVTRAYLLDESQHPEFVATIGGTEYAWVYKVRQSGAPADTVTAGIAPGE